MGVALQPVHNMFEVSTMAAALTPDKHSLHHMVAHCTYAGTLVTPRAREQTASQTSLHQILTKTINRKYTRNDDRESGQELV